MNAQYMKMSLLRKLRAMLALGQSQEWQTALEALTGTRELSGKSMLIIINHSKIG